MFSVNTFIVLIFAVVPFIHLSFGLSLDVILLTSLCHERTKTNECRLSNENPVCGRIEILYVFSLCCFVVVFVDVVCLGGGFHLVTKTYGCICIFSRRSFTKLIFKGDVSTKLLKV